MTIGNIVQLGSVPLLWLCSLVINAVIKDQFLRDIGGVIVVLTGLLAHSQSPSNPKSGIKWISKAVFLPATVGGTGITAILVVINIACTLPIQPSITLVFTPHPRFAHPTAHRLPVQGPGSLP